MSANAKEFAKISKQISELSTSQKGKFDDMEKLLQTNKASITSNCERLDSVEDQLLEQQRRSRKE